MKNIILTFALAAMGTMTFGLVLSPTVGAADCVGVGCAAQGANSVETGGSKTSSLTGVVKIIVNVMLFIVGVLSVIMIVLGGIRYTTSNGDSTKVTAAKNTIMYAIIGLLVSIVAYAIVNFVIKSFS